MPAPRLAGTWDLKSADDTIIPVNVELSNYIGVQQMTLEVVGMAL